MLHTASEVSALQFRLPITSIRHDASSEWTPATVQHAWACSSAHMAAIVPGMRRSVVAAPQLQPSDCCLRHLRQALWQCSC